VSRGASRVSLVTPALLVLLFVAFVASLAWGELRLTPSQVWQGLLRNDELSQTVIWNLRLPRALVGMSVGAALAASGVVMQAFFRNALASPGLLGVSSGAALGAVLAIALGWSAASLWTLPIASLFGAFLATGTVILMAEQGASMERLLLSGVALNALLGAATSFVLSLASSQFEKTGQIIFWMMGGLEDRTWEHVLLSAPGILIGCMLLLPLGRGMNLLSLGEQGAQSLGVDVRRLRGALIILSTLLTALATAVTGVIGFVGLLVPHTLRLLIGPDHRRLLPLSMLGGAAFVLLCDLAVRVVGGGLRLGVVTALIGGPFFLMLLRRKP
jgi:iron complex transport system permease protein